MTQPIFTRHRVHLGKGLWQQKVPLHLLRPFSDLIQSTKLCQYTMAQRLRSQCLHPTVLYLSPIALVYPSKSGTITQGEKGVCIHWIELTYSKLYRIFFRGYRNIYKHCTHLSVENVSRYTSLAGEVSKVNRGRRSMVVFCSFYLVSGVFFLPSVV